MNDKYRAAIVRHEKAKRAVDSLTRDIGIAISRCEIVKKANDPLISNSERDELWDDVSGKHKSHLWHAFKFRDISSCGWGTVNLDDDGVSDALAECGEFECRHCYYAYRMILARRKARHELGCAKLSIRALGRKAMEEASHG
ncbi:hypothetical protein D9M71_80820 [compost metagenome]